MNLKVGIVGLPNAGKSTLFNALLRKQVADVAAYPFCTIEPNVGIVPVPDNRLEALAAVIEKTEGAHPPLIPAIVEFVDIAGLVKGASVGEGLGNKFLSHIREVNIICHVMRYFPDPTVVHVAETVDPTRDKEIIETELILSDMQTLSKQQEPRGVKDRDAQKRWGIITRLQTQMNAGKNARDVVVDPEEIQLIRDLQLLTMKPVIAVGNVSEQQLTNNQYSLTDNTLMISAKTEMELASLPRDEEEEYLLTLGLGQSGLDRLIARAYETLGLMSFLTAGIKEVRAWTIPLGTSAVDAAGVIHTDFMKKFIKADSINWQEFVTDGGWTRARSIGHVRQEGRDYIMRDGDVVEFKIGA